MWSQTSLKAAVDMGPHPMPPTLTECNVTTMYQKLQDVVLITVACVAGRCGPRSAAVLKAASDMGPKILPH